MAVKGNQHARKRVATTEAAPWSSWRARSLHGRAIRFIETYCVPSKGHGAGKPLKLGTWQKQWLEEALHPSTTSGLMTLPRGNGKSTFGGAIATWAAADEFLLDVFDGAPQIPVVATGLKQAKRGVYGAAAAFCKTHPELRSRVLEYRGSGEERLVFEHTGDGVDDGIFPIASDYDGLQGLNFSVALIDEVGFIDFGAWEALDSGEGKRSRSLILGLGTRRPDNVPNALDTLLDRVALHGGIDGLLVTDYHARPPANGKQVDPTDRTEWRRANPAIADGYLRENTLESLLQKLGRDRFTTLRLNVKTGSQSGWLGEDGPTLWRELRDPWTMVNGAPTWVGVDVSMHHDCTAVAHVQQRPDGRLYVACRIWTPGRNQPIPFDEVSQHIRELSLLYKVEQVAYDPRYFAAPAQDLEAEAIPMVEVPQSHQRMVPLVGETYRAILAKTLTHDAGPEFTAHVLNAQQHYGDSTGFTLSKAKSKTKAGELLHIDGAVAMCLAVGGAVFVEPEQEVTDEMLSVY